MTIYCPRCGGGFTCCNCEYPLRKVKIGVPSAATEPDLEPRRSAIRKYLETVRRQTPYVVSFPIGPRGGAMIDFGDMIVIECFLPYVDDETGEVLPFVPMPLGGDKVHDLSKSNRAVCEAGLCACERPTGWRLTRPILRALLGVSDAFLNEHSSELPGRLPGWRLSVGTLDFMREMFFNEEFAFPTREVSREARRQRHSKRCNRRPPPPRSRSRKGGSRPK